VRQSPAAGWVCYSWAGSEPQMLMAEPPGDALTADAGKIEKRLVTGLFTGSGERRFRLSSCAR
jgi:hypothetical protein